MKREREIFEQEAPLISARPRCRVPDNSRVEEPSANSPANQYYVLKGREILGPFSTEDLEAGLANGHFAGTDFVQVEGHASWLPLQHLISDPQDDMRGALAPTWGTILSWLWLRFRYNLGEQSLAAGIVCVAVGLLSLVLSRWPIVFWLPWTVAAAVAAFALLRRRQAREGWLLLAAAACVPVIAAIVASQPKHAPGPDAKESSFEAAAPVASQNATSLPPSTPQLAAPREEPPTTAVVPQTSSMATPSPAVENHGLAASPAQAAAATPPSADPAPGLAGKLLPSPSQGSSQEMTSPKTSMLVPGSSASAPGGGDLMQQHRGAFTVVKGRDGSGSGFICRVGTQTWLFTNVHVAAGIKAPQFTQLDGKSIAPGAADAAVGRDILRLAIAQPPPGPLEAVDDLEQNVRIGDDVFVLGNSGGGGVVTSLKGEIVGIGPDRVEVTAEFIPGNSGSPIIHAKTGKVIGIATYLTKRYDDLAGDSRKPTPPQATPTPRPRSAPGFPFPPQTSPAPATPAPTGRGTLIVRRFGYRLDNVAAWERIGWDEFQRESEQMQKISKLTEDVFDFLAALRKHTEPQFATDTLRRPATEWLKTIRLKRVSEPDRVRATQGFLNALRFMVRADVTAAEPQMKYSYFREELAQERVIRDDLYKSFDDEARELSSPKDLH